MFCTHPFVYILSIYYEVASIPPAYRRVVYYSLALLFMKFPEGV